MEYIYQLVTFLKQEPQVGEAIYGGEKGWYPQIALKRRFGLQGIGEGELIQKINDYLETIEPFDIHIGEVRKPERMPVQVLEVRPEPAIMNFHTGFIEFMGEAIVSKYGDREGPNYYPHITIEHRHDRQFEPTPFENTTLRLNDVWLVKDNEGNDESFAYVKFQLKE